MLYITDEYRTTVAIQEPLFDVNLSNLRLINNTQHFPALLNINKRSVIWLPEHSLVMYAGFYNISSINVDNLAARDNTVLGCNKLFHPIGIEALAPNSRVGGSTISIYGSILKYVYDVSLVVGGLFDKISPTL
jgi:hypothetical protein